MSAALSGRSGAASRSVAVELQDVGQVVAALHVGRPEIVALDIGAVVAAATRRVAAGQGSVVVAEDDGVVVGTGVRGPVAAGDNSGRCCRRRKPCRQLSRLPGLRHNPRPRPSNQCRRHSRNCRCRMRTQTRRRRSRSQCPHRILKAAEASPTWNSDTPSIEMARFIAGVVSAAGAALLRKLFDRRQPVAGGVCRGDSGHRSERCSDTQPHGQQPQPS